MEVVEDAINEAEDAGAEADTVLAAILEAEIIELEIVVACRR